MDRPGTCIILDKKYNIANSYGSIWTDPSPKKYYMDFRSFGPYNIFLVTDGPYTAMNYLLYICLCKNMAKSTEKCSPCMLSRNVVHLGILNIILQTEQFHSAVSFVLLILFLGISIHQSLNDLNFCPTSKLKDWIPSFASILKFPNELHVLITYTVNTFQCLWPYFYTNKYIANSSWQYWTKV
jgi:hypothetical protein